MHIYIYSIQVNTIYSNKAKERVIHKVITGSVIRVEIPKLSRPHTHALAFLLSYDHRNHEFVSRKREFLEFIFNCICDISRNRRHRCCICIHLVFQFLSQDFAYDFLCFSWSEFLSLLRTNLILLISCACLSFSIHWFWCSSVLNVRVNLFILKISKKYYFWYIYQENKYSSGSYCIYYELSASFWWMFEWRLISLDILFEIVVFKFHFLENINKK